MAAVSLWTKLPVGHGSHPRTITYIRNWAGPDSEGRAQRRAVSELTTFSLPDQPVLGLPPTFWGREVQEERARGDLRISLVADEALSVPEAASWLPASRLK